MRASRREIRCEEILSSKLAVEIGAPYHVEGAAHVRFGFAKRCLNKTTKQAKGSTAPLRPASWAGGLVET
jgi:hypothetical protein